MSPTFQTLIITNEAFPLQSIKFIFLQDGGEVDSVDISNQLVV